MNVDFLIIGQGLAGSALALQLIKRGETVLVIDRQDPGASSRVAAGLMTPLTGKGVNPAWRQRDYLVQAEFFYRQLERETGVSLYHRSPVLRRFESEKEVVKWRGKEMESGCWASRLGPDDFAWRGIHAPYGGLLMEQGAWLDTSRFLQVVKERLLKWGAWQEGEFEENEVELLRNTVSWQGVEAKKVILCQGAYGLGQGGCFGGLPHRSAKGEILTLKDEPGHCGLDQQKRYHGSGWLAPRQEGVWKAGATYEWGQLDSVPTDAGKEELLEKLASWLDPGVLNRMRVIGHEAGVRPIVRNSRPLIGCHPRWPSIGFFNGLGSKGSLMAPPVADHFAAYLTGECDLDPDLDLNRHTGIFSG